MCTIVQVSWDKVHHRLTKSLMDVIKVASSRRRNIILDQVLLHFAYTPSTR